ncbi:MAG: DedA family protein [Fimbriimonadaceae bacterium]|nr:Protein DedA [Fimbriimonadaceae bacterium]MCC6351499.1 DedA family protein [Fimbriimonadaceae bacterium]MCL4283619.1 DedA family protein [Fimbriimonadaceae bacterium]QOJ11363.1 MAG: DedA family protein [Chthonomonadaceae bacterium]
MIDLFLNLDTHLEGVIAQYGPWVYGILFAIVFMETGLVVTPFLPGDTLLFAAGIFSQPEGGLNLWLISLTFVGAALAGDNVNYQIGRLLGRRLFRNENSRVFKKSHLDRTHAFFERYGGKTIIIARFVPIVRTFTPLVAGMGAMTYSRFLMYSVAGALLWVTVCVGAGYLFGRIAVVRDNFAIAVLGIVAVSLIPAAIELLRHNRKSARK